MYKIDLLSFKYLIIKYQFYHVARGDISMLKELHLIKYLGSFIYEGFISEQEFINQVHFDYPNGVSKHGERYLYSLYNPSPIDSKLINKDIVMELSFELVRRLHYSNLPSRFTSLFGLETLEEAQIIKDAYFGGVGNIYQVECDSFIKLDMSLLRTGGTIPGNLVLAHKYWKQQTSFNPFYEVLMDHPIHISRKM